MRLFFLFLLLGGGFGFWAGPGGEVFHIEISDKKVKVFRPTMDSFRLVIQNKTLVRLVGKIVYKNSQKFIAVDSGAHKSFKLQDFKGESVFFVPLVPPLERIQLLSKVRP